MSAAIAGSAVGAAYSTAGWGQFFLCAGGAAAALSGLIFVGLCVTLGRDTEGGRARPQLARGLEALVATLNVLVISVVGLTPSIARWALAAFIGIVAVESAVAPIRAMVAKVSGPADGQPPYLFALRLSAAIATTAGLLLAAITYSSQQGGGLWWLPVAFVLAFGVAAINAWSILAATTGIAGDR